MYHAEPIRGLSDRSSWTAGCGALTTNRPSVRSPRRQQPPGREGVRNEPLDPLFGLRLGPSHGRHVSDRPLARINVSQAVVSRESSNGGGVAFGVDGEDGGMKDSRVVVFFHLRDARHLFVPVLVEGVRVSGRSGQARSVLRLSGVPIRVANGDADDLQIATFLRPSRPPLASKAIAFEKLIDIGKRDLPKS
jgi:hypothetical protein